MGIMWSCSDVADPIGNDSDSLAAGEMRMLESAVIVLPKMVLINSMILVRL